MAFFTKQENISVMLMSSVTYPYLLHYTDIVSKDLVQLTNHLASTSISAANNKSGQQKTQSSHVCEDSSPQAEQTMG